MVLALSTFMVASGCAKKAADPAGAVPTKSESLSSALTPKLVSAGLTQAQAAKISSGADAKVKAGAAFVNLGFKSSKPMAKYKKRLMSAAAVQTADAENATLKLAQDFAGGAIGALSDNDLFANEAGRLAALKIVDIILLDVLVGDAVDGSANNATQALLVGAITQGTIGALDNAGFDAAAVAHAAGSVMSDLVGHLDEVGFDATEAGDVIAAVSGASAEALADLPFTDAEIADIFKQESQELVGALDQVPGADAAGMADFAKMVEEAMINALDATGVDQANVDDMMRACAEGAAMGAGSLDGLTSAEQGALLQQASAGMTAGLDGLADYDAAQLSLLANAGTDGMVSSLDEAGFAGSQELQDMIGFISAGSVEGMADLTTITLTDAQLADMVQQFTSGAVAGLGGIADLSADEITAFSSQVSDSAIGALDEGGFSAGEIGALAADVTTAVYENLAEAGLDATEIAAAKTDIEAAVAAGLANSGLSSDEQSAAQLGAVAAGDAGAADAAQAYQDQMAAIAADQTVPTELALTLDGYLDDTGAFIASDSTFALSSTEHQLAHFTATQSRPFLRFGFFTDAECSGNPISEAPIMANMNGEFSFSFSVPAKGEGDTKLYWKTQSVGNVDSACSVAFITYNYVPASVAGN